MKALSKDRVAPSLAGSEDLALAGMVSKESIDFLTRQIKRIEAVIENKERDRVRMGLRRECRVFLLSII